MRGIKGLARWLHKLWHRRAEYYLGEWHFHPNAMPVPSDVDTESMLGIAKSEGYKCPEPVLFLVGGGSAKGWQFHVEVVTRDGRRVELRRHNDPKQDEEQITVVHELGWVFGWLNKEGPLGTPMQPGAFPSMNFNEDQIKCFRESKEIEK